MAATPSVPDFFAHESAGADIAPEVLVFIPGLTTDAVLNSMNTISQKIERGFRACAAPKARFRLEQRNSETYGQGSKADVARISRTDIDPNCAVDVYDLQYKKEMLSDYTEMTPLAQVTRFAIALLNCFGRVIALFIAVVHPGNAVRGALTYGLAVYFGMWLYVVSLTLAALKAITDQEAVRAAWKELIAPVGHLVFQMHPPYYGDWSIVHEFGPVAATPFVSCVTETLRLASDALLHFVNIIWLSSPRLAIALTIIGLLVPGSSNLLSRAATQLVAMLNYFNVGEKRNRVSGQMGDLIRYLSQRQMDVHQTVSLRIASHSFGCVLMVDTLCFSDEVPNQYYGNIRSVCTIGNPIAIINAFWAKHFQGLGCRRFTAPLLNIWSRDDVLSTELNTIAVSDKLHTAIEDYDYSRAATYARPTWFDLLTGFMFRAHTMYWDQPDHPDASCFNNVVRFFYGDTPMLKDPNTVADPAATGAAPTTSYCDIVMKGGVTSGVVYPAAVVEISKTFSFKNVGGTSAGAIAAALTAAAQLGRLHGTEAGFSLLKAIPDELATNHLLFRLFRPNRKTKALFSAVTVLFARKSMPRKVLELLFAHWEMSALGTIPALILLLNGERKWYDMVCAGALAFGGACCACAVAFIYDFRRGLRNNCYGLVTGITDDRSGAPALTSWLEEKLRIAAGLNDHVPLTFGMLWDSKLQGPSKLAQRPQDVHVNLEMVTTCLTLGRPFKFPLNTSRFYFRPDEFRRYFPKHVIDWMIKQARQPTDDEETNRHEERRRRGYIPLPPIGDLPVIVATRMSLSFPILFSAVPLHMVDYSDPANSAKGTIPNLEPCWFSDGGLSSNFPISLFDAPLPRWPTFAMNLDAFPPHVPKNADQSKNIMMPESNRSGILRQFNRFNGIHGFLASIVATMQNWSDSTQAVMPGYRDRIVTVFLADDEGGLNLDMPTPLLKNLRERGAAAGQLIATRFSDAAGLPNAGPMNWANHRWLRLRTLFGALQTYLEEYADGYDDAKDEWAQLVSSEHPSYKVTGATAAQMSQLLRELETVSAAFEQATGLESNLPKPPPDLVLRPDLSSAT